MPPLRVLIIEDSEDDALLLLRELKRGGYETHHERVDTPEAMENALADSDWDVIISDYRMPRFDAPGALAAAREAGSDAPFIVVSGKVGEEAAVGIMKAGAHDCVMKDNLARLCVAVERGLEEAESRRKRRRIEQELRESRERFELAVRGADDGLWDWDLRTNTVYYSPRWKSILGYEDHEIEHRFEEWEERVHPDDRERAMREIQAHLDGLAPHYELEHRLLHKDGSYRWIRARGTSVRDDNGKPCRLAGAHWDVTERKKDEENLRRREAILEAVRFAAERFLVHPDGWERGIEESLGRLGKAAEASRVYIFENFSGEDGELFASQRYEWVAEGVSAQIDKPVLKAMPYRKAGFGRWVEALGGGDPVYGHVRDFPESEQPELRSEEILSIAIVPIFAAGKWWGFVGFDECTSEREWSAADMDALQAAASTLGAALRRRLMEAELREGEERYRAVVEQATDAIFLLDTGTKRLTEANAAFRKMFGYTASEVPEVEVYDLVAHSRENVDATIRRTLEERRRLVGERKYRRKDGSLVDVEVGVSVIFHGGRELICTICRDVTERKRSEEKVRTSEAELRALFEAMDDPIFVIDGEGRHLEVAPTNASNFYRPPAEIAGRTLHDVFPTEQADEFLGHVRRALKTRRKVGFEYALAINGERTWFEGVVSPMLDDSVIWVARDVTERKKSRDRLEESEERFKGLAEATFEGVAITRDGKIVETNAAFADMFGYDLPEVIGMTPLEVTAPESCETVLEARASELEEPYEAVLLRKDGTTFDAEIRGKMSRYKGRNVRVTAFRDITERKRHERTLRESEERFRAAFDSAAIGMGLVDLDGGWLRVNQPLCDIVGYSERELLNLTFQNITHPDDLDGDLRQVERVLRGEVRAYQMEKRYLHKEGRIVWILLSVALVRDGEGDPLYFISQIEDITPRKQAEEDLKQSEELYRAVIEQATENIFLVDIDTRSIVEANPAFCEAVGYTEEELRRMTLYDVVAADRESVDRNLRLTSKEGRSFVGERRYRRKDGTFLDVEASASIILRDGRETLCAVAHDITERKKNEEALRESQRTLATLMSNLPGMAYRCRNDPGWTMEFVSEGCLELTGYPISDLIGNRRVSYGGLIHPDDTAMVWEGVQAALRERRPFQFTYRISTASGAMKWVWEQGRGVFSPEGELLALEGFVTDTTERARAQRLLEERLEILSRIPFHLTLDLPSQDTFDAMAERVVNASTAVACSVALIDSSTGFLRIEGSHGLPEGFAEGIEAVWRDGLIHSPTLKAVRERRPALAGNMRGRMLENPLYAPVHGSVREAEWDTVFIVPLVSRERALGAIHFNYLQGERPGEDEQVFLTAVADQAAVAVENVRLLAEARGKAALEERQRLARELHDSVSQALYGIVLGTRTARTLLERNPERAVDPLDYVLSLAEAGLDEMRALIFELRPESLEAEGLVAALEKQAAAMRSRHELEVEAALCEEPDVALETKEAIYRIAQEALHNTIKHARAGGVSITMDCGPEQITLEVSDDGVGFDTEGDFPGHLGLHSMRERVSRLGGTLDITSASGEGVRVRASIPC